MKLLSGTGLGVVSLLLILLVVAAVACESPTVTLPPASPTPPGENQSPAIYNLVDERPIVLPFGSTKITCTAADPEGDTLTYTWSATGGSFSGTGPIVIWTAPAAPGTYKITVTVTDGRGGSAEGTLTVNVVTNRPPVISTVLVAPAVVFPGKSADITCVATDPDGDELNYGWEAGEGTIVGGGSKVAWVAPTQVGEYLIRITVTDGKGGSTSQNISLQVIGPEKTITLNLVAGESGSVYWDGFLTKDILAGDDKNNLGIRGYFSFDITPLAGTKIVGAKLTFFLSEVVSRPFISLGELHLERVDYGAYPLGRNDWGIDGIPLKKFFDTLPVEMDVTSQIDYLVRSVNPRFQVRARFEHVTDNNYSNNYILFKDATLTVTYIEQ